MNRKSLSSFNPKETARLKKLKKSKSEIDKFKNLKTSKTTFSTELKIHSNWKLRCTSNLKDLLMIQWKL